MVVGAGRWALVSICGLVSWMAVILSCCRSNVNDDCTIQNSWLYVSINATNLVPTRRVLKHVLFEIIANNRRQQLYYFLPLSINYSLTTQATGNTCQYKDVARIEMHPCTEFRGPTCNINQSVTVQINTRIGFIII